MPPLLQAAAGIADGQESALRAHAAIDRLRRELAVTSQRYSAVLQPTADMLGRALGLADASTAVFSEEVVRGTAAAPLSQVGLPGY